MTVSGWVRWRSEALTVSDFPASPVSTSLLGCVARQPAPTLSAATKNRRSLNRCRPRPAYQVPVEPGLATGSADLSSPTFDGQDASGARTAYPPTPTPVVF